MTSTGRARRRAGRLAVAALGSALVLLGASSCGSTADRRGRAVHDATPWRYDATLNEAGDALAVEGRFPSRRSRWLFAREACAPFVRDLEVRTARGWVGARRDRDARWPVPTAASAPLTVRWRFDLDAAARELRRIYLARRANDAFLAPPSSWLVWPGGDRDAARVELAVRTVDPAHGFATGIAPTAGGAVVEFAAADVSALPYSIVGRFRRFVVPLDGGAAIDLCLLPGRLRASDDEVVEWVRRSAGVVADWFGRFPGDHALVIVEPRRGGGIARAIGSGGAAVHYPLEPWRRAPGLRQDWVLVHELVHLACPTLARRHRWLEEGLATWVEPIARCEAGLVSLDSVWDVWLRQMPHGLPRPGDRGLDRTPTWGRTYWGGALFCLLAELEIRDATDGRLGLRDAWRGIVAAGGTIDDDWTVERTLAAGDAAIGGSVLIPLYERMRHDPHPVDLAAIWRSLGVAREDGRVTFDDDAPRAEVRRLMIPDGATVDS